MCRLKEDIQRLLNYAQLDDVFNSLLVSVVVVKHARARAASSVDVGEQKGQVDCQVDCHAGCWWSARWGVWWQAGWCVTAFVLLRLFRWNPRPLALFFWECCVCSSCIFAWALFFRFCTLD